MSAATNESLELPENLSLLSFRNDKYGLPDFNKTEFKGRNTIFPDQMILKLNGGCKKYDDPKIKDLEGKKVICVGAATHPGNFVEFVLIKGKNCTYFIKEELLDEKSRKKFGKASKEHS